MVTAAELMRTDPPAVSFARRDDLGQALDSLGRHDFATFRISADHAKIKEELLDRFARALHFPRYFGGNWDALADCPADMGWAPAEGYVIVIDEAQDLWSDIPDADRLVAIAQRAADEWRARGKPFHLVFVGSASAAPRPGSGAHAPT